MPELPESDPNLWTILDTISGGPMDLWYRGFLMLPTPQKGCSVLSAPVFYTDNGALRAVHVLYYCPDIAQNMIIRKALICKSLRDHEKYIEAYAKDPERFIDTHIIQRVHAKRLDLEAKELYARIKSIVSAPPPTTHRGSFIQRSRRLH